MKDYDAYTIDIIEAIVEIRKIEGPEIFLSFLPDPKYKYIRFKPYPYKRSLLRKLMEKYNDKDFAMAMLGECRVQKYLDDYIELPDDEALHFTDSN